MQWCRPVLVLGIVLCLSSCETLGISKFNSSLEDEKACIDPCQDLRAAVKRFQIETLQRAAPQTFSGALTGALLGSLFGDTLLSGAVVGSTEAYLASKQAENSGPLAELIVEDARSTALGAEDIAARAISALGTYRGEAERISERYRAGAISDADRTAAETALRQSLEQQAEVLEKAFTLAEDAFDVYLGALTELESAELSRAEQIRTRMRLLMGQGVEATVAALSGGEDGQPDELPCPGPGCPSVLPCPGPGCPAAPAIPSGKHLGGRRE